MLIGLRYIIFDKVRIFGFKYGMIFTDFYIVGTVLVVNDRLIICAIGQSLPHNLSACLVLASHYQLLYFVSIYFNVFRTYPGVILNNLKMHLVRRGLFRRNARYSF